MADEVETDPKPSYPSVTSKPKPKSYAAVVALATSVIPKKPVNDSIDPKGNNVTAVATSSAAVSQKGALWRCGSICIPKLGNKTLQKNEKLKELSGASFGVSGDHKKEERKSREANDKWRKTCEAVTYLRSFLQENVPTGEIKGVVDVEELKSLQNDIACYLEEEQNNVSATLKVSESDGHEKLLRPKIGKNLEFLPDKKICEGENDTDTIFEGTYKARCAVKRLSRADYDVDSNKIKLLISESQNLPNVVTYYGMECDDHDQKCIYLAMEQQHGETIFNLDELIKIDLARIYSNFDDAVTKDGLGSTSMAVLDDRLESVKNIVKDFKLVPRKGDPIPDLSYTLMRGVLSGLTQLNDELGLSHGNLKPRNILIIKKGASWRVKLSDIDISRKASARSLINRSYSNRTDYIPGRIWQAHNDCGDQIWVDDMNAFSRIFYLCITGASNIVEWGRVTEKGNSSLLNYREAYHLYCCLSSENPKESLTAKEALRHPHFWDPEKNLAFLCHTYNKVYEFKDRELRKELETTAWKVIEGKWEGQNVKTWDKRFDVKIIDYAIDQLRKHNPDSTYDYKSLPELLRLIRHLGVHYGNHDKDIQESLGSLPEGFYRYFEKKFPNLLIEVYKAVKKCCGTDHSFGRYFKDHS